MSLITGQHELQEFSSTRSDPEAELLVAYLDGELETPVKRSLEDRLAEEPELRRKIAELESSWNALNFLERDLTNQNLIFSTMEMIATRAETEVEEITKKKTVSFLKQPLFCAALLLLFTLAGYFLFSAMYRVDEKKNYEDLMIIDRMDQYQYILSEENRDSGIDELEFLRQLRDSRVLE